MVFLSKCRIILVKRDPNQFAKKKKKIFYIRFYQSRKIKLAKST